MAIEIHNFNFLRYLTTKNDFSGEVITIGRQRLSIEHDFLECVTEKKVAESEYCEEALMALGAKSVESIDFSDYEKPTYTADLNKPLDHSKKYNVVCDFGSLEHVFDIGTAFRNVIKLCKLGGLIIHGLPVNNLNGHGFWQFCSDLIYEIYSEKNGFTETEVYYASGLDARYWYTPPPAATWYLCRNLLPRTNFFTIENKKN